MFNSGWGWDGFDKDEEGRIYATKSRKGADGNITISLNRRNLYHLQGFLKSCIEREGSYQEKKGLVLISVELSEAVAEAKKLEMRVQLLGKHGVGNA